MKKDTLKAIKKLSRKELPIPPGKIIPNKKKEKIEKNKKDDAAIDLSSNT